MPVNGQQLYVSPDWAAVLGAQGLDCFEAWWALQLDEVEPGNRRRGGWSTVFRHVVDGAGGLFVKRQEDHVYRTLRHPLRGRLTVEREFQVLRQCRAAGIAVPEPVLYGARQDAGHLRGVLVTRELAGYRALVDVLDDWQRSGWPERATRERLLRAVADVLRRLHALKLEHRCLYPKHVMVHTAWLAGERDRVPAPVALIDLEKCKRRWRRADCTRRDLDTLNRRSAGWSRTDRRRFLGYYLGAGRRLDAAGRRLWRQLARRS
jgi:tRNA A-37 threonylcarbamoyl transferase component Bud32